MTTLLLLVIAVAVIVLAVRLRQRRQRRRGKIVKLVAFIVFAVGTSAGAETNVRVGWCTKAVTSATSPWAIAMKLGWMEKAGLSLTVIPTAGSADCMKLVATRDYLLALSGIEALATMREQGVKMKIIYTAYRNYIFGIKVPADSPIKTVAVVWTRSATYSTRYSSSMIPPSVVST